MLFRMIRKMKVPSDWFGCVLVISFHVTKVFSESVTFEWNKWALTVKSIILKNFKLLQNDTETGTTFRNTHFFLVAIKTTSKLHFYKFSQQNKTCKINFLPSQSINIWRYKILPFTDIAKFLTSREVFGYNFYDVRLVIWILPLSGRPVPSTNADWK